MYLQTNLQMLASEKHVEEQEKEVKRQAVSALRVQLIHTQASLDEVRTRREEAQQEASDRQIKLCEVERENKMLRVAKDDLSQKLNVEVGAISLLGLIADGIVLPD